MVVKPPCPVKTPRTPVRPVRMRHWPADGGNSTPAGRPWGGSARTATGRRTMDEARARDVLAAAGVLPGRARDARLLALGENAVFAAGDLVVKVGRDAELLDRARRELAVAVWLAEQDVPAVRAAGSHGASGEGPPGALL